MNRLSKWKGLPGAISLLIILLVFAVVLTLSRLGVLQSVEFQAYDLFIRSQPKAPSSDPLVLVEMTESDIHSPSLDYPIHDSKLAELLEILAADQPAAIGLDVWRDIPVPKSGAGAAALDQVFTNHPNIIAIFTLGGIKAPAVLRSNPDRIAFNDNFPVDVDVDHTIPKVRRTVLLESSSSETNPGELNFSLPFRLALLYLETKGITPSVDPKDPSLFHLGKAHLRGFHATDGAYVGADTGGTQMLLDFKCPTEFRRYTFSQVLEGRIPKGSLRDKVVMIGMNTPSVSDERVTPILRNHRGVELQSMAVHQLLRYALNGDEPLRFWSDRSEDAWLLLWCLVGGAIGFWVRSPWRFAASSLLCVIATVGGAWMAFRMGWWIPAITPAVGCLPAAVFATSYVSSQERSMRAVLMKLYSRHVSKEIAEAIWDNRDSFLEGRRPLAQKLVVTVLFTDLKGFTTISERLEPARLYEWLNGYLGAMAHVIQEHGGVLKQFTGDGVMALFGVPVPHTTREQQSGDASAAVRCAIAMGRRLVELSRDWAAAGLPAVSMRAGIYTGEVAAGSVGSDDRFEYAVIGDVVNTASRLESYDKSIADPDQMPNRCRILIGAPTHELLGPGYNTREIGLLQLKGKVEKVAIFQVLDEPTGPSPS